MSNGNQPSSAPVIGQVRGYDGNVVIGALIQVQGSLSIDAISEAPDGSFQLPQNPQAASSLPSVGDTLTAGSTGTQYGDDSVTLDRGMLFQGGDLPGWHFKVDFTLPEGEDSGGGGGGDDDDDPPNGWLS